MVPFAAPSTCAHWRISVTTVAPTEFVDITDHLAKLVASAGMRLGILNVQTLHTTTAIVVNEHEPLLFDDFARLLDRTAPAGLLYRHDDPAIRRVNLTPGERVNGHAHCRALLLGTAACLNVVDRRLQLGCWQRVFLVELDGPRERAVSVVACGEGTR